MIFVNSDLRKYLLDFRNHLRSERGLSESTIATYSHHLKAYTRFLSDGKSNSTTVTKALLSAYIGQMRARTLGSTTIFCAIIAIRTFHRFLLERGFVESDPCIGLSMPELKIPVVEPLSVVEVERLLDAPSPHSFVGLRDRAILELLYCGLRISEALGLDRAQLHFDEKYVKVTGKGSRSILVPIGSKAIGALRGYHQKKIEKLGDPEGALFLSRAGARLGKNGFWRRFKRYAARAGITRRAYPHLLRHSFAVHLLQGKADLRSLQLLLGHSSLTSTQRYLNLNHQALQETCQRSHPRFLPSQQEPAKKSA